MKKEANYLDQIRIRPKVQSKRRALLPMRRIHGSIEQALEEGHIELSVPGRV